MSEIKSLPSRSELPEALTWDLTKIFKDEQAFEAAFKKVEAAVEEVQNYKGTLNDGAVPFQKAIEAVLAIYRELETLYVYAHLKNDEDKTDAKAQALYSRASSLAAKVSEATAWLDPEILALPEARIQEYFAENADLKVYEHFVEDITRTRAHVLSGEQEALLAGAGELFDAASNTFGILNNADLDFPVIEDEKGEKVKLSHGVYGQLLESVDPKVRENAFKGLYKVYQQFANTFASTLSSHVKVHNYQAKIRGYASAREAALNANRIPEVVYDNLLAVVKKNLPLLHRYVALRKKLLKVDQLHSYDLYTPLLGEAPIRYTYEEATQKALEALKPLGDEYLEIVKTAFADRWIDVVENKGKRSGAYSSGCYDTAPYILLNWHDSLDQLYTLVHEMGHSLHSYYTRHNQPYVYGDYSIFLAEIASTTNENLLTEYLLQTEKDPKVRAYILNHYLDGFKGTVFRQTQFAEFEHFIHTEDAKGVALTSDYLVDYYGKLNAEYYGPALEKDPEIAYEWSRIPHFYYNYYVYQYSTGFSAASALANKILNEKDALPHYLAYLKAGSSDYPLEVMKKAGVDMTKVDYLEEAMKIFAKRLEELEELVKTL